MPLDASSIIQINSGSFEASSGTVSLGAATTAGNMVVVAVAGMSLGAGANTDFSMTGFDKNGFAPPSSWQTTYIFSKGSGAGGETSWTLNVTVNGPQQVEWTAMEVQFADLEVWPWTGFSGIYLSDAVGSGATSVSTLQTQSSSSGAYDVLGIAVHAASAASGVIPDITGHTGNWQEQASVSRSNVARGLRMSVSARNYLSLGPLSVTASISPASPATATMVVLVAAGARLAPVVNVMCGFEFGTATTLTQVGSAGDLAVFDEVAGTPEVVSTFARTGSYSLKLSATSAIENASWISGTGKNLSASGLINGGFPLCFYFDGSLPGSDVELFSIESASSSTNSVKVWYRSASQKIGVKVGTGAEQLSDATVAANKWIGVELLYDPRTTSHTCDWYVDYDSTDATGPVLQTQATNTGMTADVVTRVRLGWTGNTTATVYYDDALVYSTRQAFPMGLVNIRPLRPDPGGTATTSGSSSAFNTFVSNGSMSAFTSAAAISALDEIPPVVGASADGVAQVSTDVGNYCRVPLGTYNLAPNDVARAVRMYSLGWAAGASAGALAVRGYDGTVVPHSMGGDLVDAGFDSAAYWWLTSTFKDPSSSLSYVVTQARLDALAIEFGASGDANPDVGILFALAEVATQPATVYIASESGAGHTVYVRQDPLSSAIASVTAVTPSGSGGTLHGTVGGADFSVYVPPADIYVHNIGASDIGEVTSLGFAVDPTT